MTATLDALTLEAADWGRGGAVRLGTVAEFDAQRCRVRVRVAGEGDEAVRTAWLPWATWAAGHLRVWSPPAVGEQCLLLAPSGDLEQAVAMPAAFEQQGDFPAPSDDPEHTLLQWDDGGFIRYERDTGSLFVHAPNLIQITLDDGGYIRYEGDTSSLFVHAPSLIQVTSGDGGYIRYEGDTSSLFVHAPNLIQITSGDGGYIRYEGDTHRLILHAPCAVRIEGDLLVTGDVYAGDVSLRRHRHTGVASGIRTSGGPTGGEAPACQ